MALLKTSFLFAVTPNTQRQLIAERKSVITHLSPNHYLMIKEIFLSLIAIVTGMKIQDVSQYLFNLLLLVKHEIIFTYILVELKSKQRITM